VIVEDLPIQLDELLDEHGDHVYIDLSWVVYEDYVLTDLDRWVDVIEKHPDNFMVGSDKVARFENYASEIRKYDVLFSALRSPETVRKVASGNFLQIMPEAGISLPRSYAYPESSYIWHTRPSADRPVDSEPLSEARP
jgi:hypothetical protein